MLEQRMFRFSDPETSVRGSEHVTPKLGKLQSRIMRVAEKMREPSTAMELATETARQFGGMVESYRKRIHELVRDGRLTSTGTKQCSVTGQVAMAYQAKEDQE